MSKLQLLTTQSCVHCAEVKKILAEIKLEFPDLDIKEIDIAASEG